MLCAVCINVCAMGVHFTWWARGAASARCADSLLSASSAFTNIMVCNAVMLIHFCQGVHTHLAHVVQPVSFIHMDHVVLC